MDVVVACSVRFIVFVSIDRSLTYFLSDGSLPERPPMVHLLKSNTVKSSCFKGFEACRAC